MKEFYRFCSAASLCSFFCLFIVLRSTAQVQTARNISTGPNSNGFYEYLPAGYETGSQTYPLMVFIHGLGELGNGGSDLSLVLRNGPPKLISEGIFPTSFTVDGSSFSFIVLSPQFTNWPNANDVDDVINYAVQHYRVDRSRIYVTGLSMGGGSTWQYAAAINNFTNKAVAILPVSGATNISSDQAQNIASAHLAVYATHNLLDGTVSVLNTIGNIGLVNSSSPPPSPMAIDTIFDVSGHDAWDKTYDPAFLNPRIGNLNVYQWLLQFHSGIILPVTLTDYKALLSNDRSSVTVDWTTTREENNKYFILQRSADGHDFSNLDTIAASNQPAGHSYSVVDDALLAGNNFYRLSQVDNDGKTTFFTILEVKAPTPANAAVFKVSPNPARNTLTLELIHPGIGPLQVRLFDAQGKIIKAWKFDKRHIVWDQTLDITNIPPGNYFTAVEGNAIKEVKQFIKE